jgi:hypothetical protein
VLNNYVRVVYLLFSYIIIAMKTFDRLMRLNADLCQPDNLHYQAYQLGKCLTALSIIALSAVLTGESLEPHFRPIMTEVVLGTFTAAELIGGTVMVLEVPHLSEQPPASN